MQSLGNGGSRMLRNSPRQQQTVVMSNRGGGVSKALSAPGPGRTPQTHRKEFSLQQHDNNRSPKAGKVNTNAGWKKMQNNL